VQYAGVAFSRDPIDQGDDVVVEALAGGAAQVVSGQVTPKQYRLTVNDAELGQLSPAAVSHISDNVPPPQSAHATVPLALVQSEQMGTGIAQVLRRQADDLRDRRRQQANAFAMTLPVKRMLPLVVCFLPALFVWTLGPAFVQLFKIADSFIKVGNF